jgi:UDP-N-acetylmuramate: L-alanyl-gamma-D-glutamyl-meso-diaminopimelate ligase
MHIHILGICGTFMAGIAALAKSGGHKVTGCDQNVYPPMSTQLKEQGITIIEGFGKDQVSLNPDIYIIGNVITRGNPLMETILTKNLAFQSGPQWLYENILHDKWVLAVAGTHGKTTTSAMLTWILEYNKMNPGYLIGGIPLNLKSSARLPLETKKNIPSFFVIEADEYDTAFFDKRSKFIHYHPRTLILNNLEFDHADIFDNLDHIKKHFHHLIRIIPQEGQIISNSESKALKETLDMGMWSEIEYFSDEKGWSYQIKEDWNSLYVLYKNKNQGVLNWDLIGHHNASNALAAIAAAKHIGITPENAIEALSLFKSVKKRMEKIAAYDNGINLYDDFAHHPTAIMTTLAGMKKTAPKGRIIAVIEPRSNTMKLGSMKKELINSLKDADKVYCYANNLSWNAKELFAHSQNVIVSDNIEFLANKIAQDQQNEDQIIFMSNGSFANIQTKVVTLLQ